MPAENAESRIDHYAKALTHLAYATGEVDASERQVLAVVETLENTPELLAFLGDPTVQPAGKEQALREALADTVHDTILLFLVMVLAEGAIADFPAIADTFFAETSARRKQASGRLVTARPVSSETLARIEEEIGKVIGKDVHLLVQEDASLLGGMRVQVGDFVVDGTVDRILEDARRALARP
jgi:F-type H+-transporting ATPase subunit delta